METENNAVQQSDTIPDANKVVPRETPTVAPARAALVKDWTEKVKGSKEHFKDDFKRIREDMDYAYYGADKNWVDGKNYVVPIIQRHINQSVATLYAKNPKAQATLKKRLMYQVWDGDPQTLQAAMQTMQMTAEAAAQGQMLPVDPRAAEIVQDVEQVQMQRRLMQRVAATTEILFDYYTGEQEPNFKLQMKQLVRRAKVCGVGYLWLGFQRLLEPDIVARIEDTTSKLQEMEQLAADVADGQICEGEKEIEALKLLLKDLQTQPELIVREGPVFDFPKATEIIIDKACTQLKGFIGAGFIAREFHFSTEKVQQLFGIDVKQQYRAYTDDNAPKPSTEQEANTKKRGEACVWWVFDKDKKQQFFVCDGYPDFLKEPASPDVFLERFWPCFTLTFNDIEDERRIYPPSDVHMLKDAQNAYNASRQGLREHRHANRPKYVTTKGALEETDKNKLLSSESNAVLELNALQVGQKVGDLIQPMPTIPIDPNVYETKSAMEDVYLTVGAQEATLGPTSGATATETSIAETSRSTSASSNVDDLDEFLSDVARATGQMMLLELSDITVKKIAGPGAVWPEVNRQQVCEEIELKVKAGSSGRPNAAADLAKMERGMPFMVQIPGLNPTVIGRHYVKLLDFVDDPDEAFIPGLPSIVALNQMAGKQAQAGTGDPATDPGAQGSKGGSNEKQPDQNEPGPQPAYPAPMAPPI